LTTYPLISSYTHNGMTHFKVSIFSQYCTITSELQVVFDFIPRISVQPVWLSP